MVNLELTEKASLLGGPESDRFDPREAWYPVFYVRDLETQEPNAFTLLGIDLVIWWDAATQRCAPPTTAPNGEDIGLARLTNAE